MQSKHTLIHILFLQRQPIRYILNGLFATLIHFLVLTINLKVLHWQSAGIANGIAAIFGITASFLGSRYFVFLNSKETIFTQAYRFIFLYVSIAFLHALLLYLWVDKYEFNYIIGFLLATIMQLIFSYFGNKVVVFKV